jgi:ATP-dependent helicase/nuclease subunit A
MSEPVLDPGLQQRRAYARDASVWVAASAGTGKTKVLTDRVLALLLHGSAPSRLLCLTFTKAAAAEMANRINTTLSEWAVLGDGTLAERLQQLTGEMPDQDRLEQARQLFARVLDAPGGMTIATIHAFCQSLLRRFPREAGVPPHFEVMDERTSGEALDAAREAVLMQARREPGAALAQALAIAVRHVHEASFAELLGELVRERARLDALLAHGFERFAAGLRQVLDVAEGETPENIIAAACARNAADEPGLRRAAELMQANSAKRDKERGGTIARWLADPGARIDVFADYLCAFFNRDGDRFKDIVTPKLAERHPDIAAIVMAEAARLDEVRRRCGAAEIYAATAALVRLAAAIIAEYEAHKAARALLDYDDLVLRSRDLLCRPGIAPWVLFKLDGGLDHILIDEAQDTNPEQWEIVRLIAAEFFTGQGARETPRTVFAVGDGKQSIYSFQRADPAKFVEMRLHFEEVVRAAQASWRLVPLEISFRSVDAVLRAVDAVFAPNEAGNGVALGGVAIRHEAFRRGAAGLVEWWPAIRPEAAEAPPPWTPPLAQRAASAPRARLAAAIAATIRHWLDTGARLEARDRRIRPGDVMMLVRRRGPFVTELVRALKQAKVPVAGVDRMLLTDQLAVEDMIALGQFLLLPEDDLTLAIVLKGPLFGIDEAALFDLAWPRTGTLWAELLRRRDERPEFAYAATELNALLARADFVTPYALFAEVLGARHGRKAVLARLGPEAGDPLDEFLAAALAYERAHGISLQGFLHWLSAGTAEIKRDLEQGGRDEVRVLTVHGAKGLEAPIVFLPDTTQMPRQLPKVLWGEQAMPFWPIARGALPMPVGAARAVAQRRRDQEYRRLLYVAMTRAADRLYVCGWETKQAPPAGNWHALVRAGLEAAGATTFDFAPVLGAGGWPGEGLRLLTPQQAKPEIERQVVRVAAGAAVLPEWSWHAPPPEPAPPRPLVPSQPLGEEPAARSPLGVDLGLGFLRGRLVHRLLQSLPELPPDRREAAARRFLALPVHGLAPTAQEAILRETLAVLTDPDFAALFAPGSAAEVAVVGLVNGRALSGQIDRLVVTATQVTIVDYKTLRPVPSEEGAIPPAYLDQLAAYRAAVAAVYPGHEIRCALLWTDGPRLMPVSAERLA